MPYFRSFFKLNQNFMFGEVVLEELNKICNRKFKLKIVLKFRNNSMCSIEMKPLCLTHGALV